MITVHANHKHRPEAHSDLERAKIGQQVAAKMGAEGFDRDAAEEILRSHGFTDRIEWVDSGDDILLLLLWRFVDSHLIEEFIIEFSGYDSINVTVFCVGAEAEDD